MIFVSAFVPLLGRAVLDTLTGPLGRIARCGAKNGKPLARVAFCNGMSRAQRAFARSRICTDAVRVAAQPVDRSDLPPGVPRTWIMTPETERSRSGLNSSASRPLQAYKRFSPYRRAKTA